MSIGLRGRRGPSRRSDSGGSQKNSRIPAALLVALVTVAGASAAHADADDAAWIKRCVADNKNEGATPAVVAAYCSCMNNKMSSSETLSITAWEKKHPAEQAACSKEAGWK